MGGTVDTIKNVGGQITGAMIDPLNISGYGGIPGVNGGSKNPIDAFNDIKGDLTGKNAMDAAIGAQTTATGKANLALKGSYEDQQKYLNPYADAGSTALSKLAGGNLVDSNSLTSDPGYQFRLAQGNTAINNAAAARGLGNSGATLKALTKYGQDYASNEYNNAYNRQYNTLTQLAGYGSNASNNLAGAAGSYGSNLSNNIMGLGNATAAANIAQSNQQNALIGQGIGAAATFFSDENLKENIAPINPEDLAEMKKQLKAYAFNYKDESHGKGEWIGVMAQDLQKSKLGKTLVIEKDGVLQVDSNKVMSLFLATLAEG